MSLPNLSTFSSAGLQLVGAIALLGAIFGGAAVMQRLRVGAEFTRKFVHISASHAPLLAWLFGLPGWLCLGICLVFVAIAYASYYLPVLPAIDGVGRKTRGVFYYALSITLLVLWFWQIGQPQYAAMGTLVMGWGDGLAALIGKRWGKQTFWVNGNVRTIEGSLAMAIASYLVMVAVLFLAQPSPPAAIWLVPIPVAMVATTLEAISPGGTDNLTVPIASGALCYALTAFTLPVG